MSQRVTDTQYVVYCIVYKETHTHVRSSANGHMNNFGSKMGRLNVLDNAISFTARKGEAHIENASGLGLFISRQIVEAHNGKILVSDSELGGAKMSIELN